MKLKKIVAGMLAAAVVLTSVLDMNLLTYAAEDVAAEDVVAEDAVAKEVEPEGETTETSPQIVAKPKVDEHQADPIQMDNVETEPREADATEETLESLLAEAKEKSEASTSYTKDSREKLKSVMEEAQNVDSDDEIAVAEAKENLKEALKKLEKLYTIKIIVGEANVEITPGDDGEVHTDEAGNKIIYVAHWADITAVNHTEFDADDKIFSGWIYKGKKVSSNSTYNFFVISDIELSLQYEVQKDPAAEVKLDASAIWDDSTQRNSFKVTRNTPTACRIIEHGIIITDEKGWNSIYKDNPEGLVKDAYRTRKAISFTTANNGNYRKYLNGKQTDEWYGRVYVTYRWNNGKIRTVYSDIVTYPSN